MFKRILIAYVVSVVGAFALAAVVKGLFGLELGMKVQEAATCLVILPFQFGAWVISWFSSTPGAIDQTAINSAVTWVALLMLMYFGGRFLLKKFRAAWAGVVGGGGGGGHH